MQTRDKQDIRGRIERFGNQEKQNQPNVVTLGDCRQTQAVIRRPKGLAHNICFANDSSDIQPLLNEQARTKQLNIR